MVIKERLKTVFVKVVPERIQPEVIHRVRWLKGEVRRRLSRRDHPRMVNIEVNTGCTRSCSYCPRDDSYSNQRLSERTWRKVIDDLVEWDYQGMLSPHMYNEPLTDERLPDLMAYARQRLPQAELALFTNGDLLSKPDLETLLEIGVDAINISIHDPISEKQLGSVRGYSEEYEGVHLIDMRPNHRLIPLSNRGGLVEVGDTISMPRCYFIDMIMVIRSDGNVVLCCQDYNKTFVAGNVGTSSVQDIWHNEEFESLRHNIRMGRYELPICQSCGYQRLIR